MPGERGCAVVLCVVAVVALARPGRAAITYSASSAWTEDVTDFDDNLTRTSTGDGAADAGASGAQVALTRGFPEPAGGSNFRSFTGDGAADAFGLRASAFGHVAISPPTAPAHHLQVRYQSGSNATVTIDDLVFTGPGGAGSVDTSLNLVVSGLLTGRFQVGTGIGQGAFRATLDAMNLGGVSTSTNVVFPFLVTQMGVTVTGEAGTIPPDNIQTRSITMSGNFTSKVVNVPLGVPLTLEVTVGTGQDTLADSVQNALAPDIDVQIDGDFSHTVRFPSSGPVFNLPDGYSVSSASGLVVDNRLDTATPTTTTVGATTTSSPVSTTTLPGTCGALVGIAGVDCVCHASIPAACAGVTVPPGVVKRFTRACAMADKAATSEKKARKLYAATSAGLHKLESTVGKRKLAAKLGAACVSALQGVFGDVRSRVDGVRGAL